MSKTSEKVTKDPRKVERSKKSHETYTLMSLIFAGTKFRGLGGHPRNLIPAK